MTATDRQPASKAAPHLHIIALFLTLTAVTLATRVGYFGNPNLHIDDQFYRLVGQRMLEGDLPYVDIWDRKPLGLFLIYAGIALLGGDGVLQYQLVAALFVLTTAIVIALFALRLSSVRGAIFASTLYIVLLPALGGEGGQAPIFYNLPVAAAALLTFSALERGHEGATRRALGAMLLCGLAMTIKQTSLFEGVAFGLLHLSNFRRSGSDWSTVAMKGAAMLCIALLPIAAIYAAYALLGHGEAIWQATVLSVFAKGPIPLADTRPQLIRIAAVLALPTALAATALFRSFKPGPDWRQTFFLVWAGGAIAGYLSIPNHFDHYALPLAVPLSVIASPTLSSRNGPLLFAAAVCAASFAYELSRIGPEERQQMQRLVEEIRPHLRGGCLYVYAGPLHPYTATRACPPSPFVFPDHLESEAESTALPVSPAIEVKRILASRPAVILTAPRLLYDRNAEVEALLRSELAKSYRPGRTITVRETPVTVWRLRDDRDSRAATDSARN